MKTIYKYPILVQDRFTVMMPRCSLVLSAQVQKNTPCMWALIDTDQPPEERHFALFGTGHEVDPKAVKFIDTFQLHEGSLVFHLFEM
jgi:hypothetical protein